MTGTPIPQSGQVEGGDSSFENVYIYGNLYYDFGSKDITFNSISVTGDTTLGDLTVNDFTVDNIEITGTLKDGDGSTGSTGQVLSFDGTDLKWINTSSANVGSASKVGINLDSDSTTTMYLTFADNTTGNEEIRVDSSLTYKPSIGSFLGITSFTGVHLLDDNKIKFGNSNDLEVYYTNGTGSDGGSVFKHTGPHDMRFQVPSGAHDIVFEDTSGNNIAVYNADGGSEFYWRGSTAAGKKFDITQTGVTVTGNIDLGDNDDIRFGDGNDLKISHTNALSSQNDSEGNSVLAGTDWASYINETGTGPLVFKSDGGPSSGAFQFYDAGWRPILKLFSGTSARAALYHSGTEKLVTDTGGIEVTGGIKDKDGNFGTSGQVLSSTGTELDWVSIAGSSDTLDTVCDRGNTTDQNITTSGSLNDAAGNVREIVNNTKTGVYTLTANDVGELINTNSNVTIPSGVFSAGQGVTIYNNSSSNISIVRSGVTAYTVGTSTDSNKTLAQKGLATVMCVSANTFVVLGGGLS